jgi:hypothetical protein
MITFKPKQVTKKLLASLPDRARDVLERRFGLGADGTIHTLESIGQNYGVTRERVRQIENYGVHAIQKSDAYKEFVAVFEELQKSIDALGGGVVAEHVLLEEITDDPVTRNHIYFLLVLGDPFYRSKESGAYAHRWYTEKKIVDSVEQALKSVYKSLQEDELVSEEEILRRFKNELIELADKYDDQILKRWLLISKEIGRNPLGEWVSVITRTSP